MKPGREVIAEGFQPAFAELICQAAQGEGFYNDDTAMKILAPARASPHSAGVEEEPASSRERTGWFTSGMVSTWQGRRRALFFTGRRQAGENLARGLAQRAAGLAPHSIRPRTVRRWVICSGVSSTRAL